MAHKILPRDYHHRYSAHHDEAAVERHVVQGCGAAAVEDIGLDPAEAAVKDGRRVADRGRSTLERGRAGLEPVLKAERATDLGGQRELRRSFAVLLVLDVEGGAEASASGGRHGDVNGGPLLVVVGCRRVEVEAQPAPEGKAIARARHGIVRASDLGVAELGGGSHAITGGANSALMDKRACVGEQDREEHEKRGVREKYRWSFTDYFSSRGSLCRGVFVALLALKPPLSAGLPCANSSKMPFGLAVSSQKQAACTPSRHVPRPLSLFRFGANEFQTSLPHENAGTRPRERTATGM